MKKISLFCIVFVFALISISIYANWKDDYIVANTKIKKVLILFDPYPSKLSEFFSYINNNKYQYFYCHRKTSDSLYCYAFFFYDPSEANDSWNEIKKTTGTAKSKVKDIGKDWDDPDLNLLLNEAP